MRYLLTSSGVTNASIRAALDAMLPEPLGRCHALVVPTAGYWFDEGPDIAWDLITGAGGGPASQLGWASVGVLELTALPSVPRERWLPRLLATDVLVVGGGDPMFLSRWLRESGLAEALRGMRDDAVWLGISGGSMAVTASFGAEYDDRAVPASGPEAPLGLVQAALYPHFEHPEMADTRADAIEAWARDVPVPAYAIDDDTALAVVDGRVEVVSEGRWRRFG